MTWNWYPEFFFFNISSKNLKWKKHFNTDTFWNYVLECGRLLGLHMKEGKRQRQKGALMSNLCLIIHRWYDVEKLTVPGSSNINLSFSRGQQKACVKKMKEKCVTFCFIKLNAKVSPKWSGEELLLLCRSYVSSFKVNIYYHIVSCWSHSHEIVEK